MPLYRAKPQIIDALPFDGTEESFQAIKAAFSPNSLNIRQTKNLDGQDELRVSNFDSDAYAAPGTMVGRVGGPLRGLFGGGRLYVFAAERFAQVFELVDGPRTPGMVPGWKLPEPPAEGLKPRALFLGPGDGIDLYWATDEQAEDGEMYRDESGNHALIPFPFVGNERDIVLPAHFEALGFDLID